MFQFKSSWAAAAPLYFADYCLY